MARCLPVIAALALVITACTGGTATTTQGPRELLPVRVTVEDAVTAVADDATLTFDPVLLDDAVAGGYEIALSEASHEFDVDITGAVGVDLLVDDEVVMEIDRRFWLDSEPGPLVVRVRSGGIVVERETFRCVGPGQCAIHEDRRHVLLRFDDGNTVLPFQLRVNQADRRSLGLPILVVEVPASGGAEVVHFDSGIERIPPSVSLPLTLATSSDLRVSVGPELEATIPAEVWTATFDRIQVKVWPDGVDVKLHVPDVDGLAWETVNLPLDE